MPCAAGGTLADYVPFYFAPRSPMPYAIHSGYVEGYEGGQAGVLHLVAEAETVVASGCVWAFTEGHAEIALTAFFTDLGFLSALDWAIMQETYWHDTELPEVQVFLYSPDGAPEPETMRVATRRPNMTPARAAVLGLIEQYALPGYRVTMLEIQKLVYFLQVAGEPLKLEFAKQQYGPYAETVHHVLQRIEGHFIRGYGDRSRDISIRLMPEALYEAQGVLAEQPETQERLRRVSALIAGYETPYGVELLSSVHWVAQEDQRARQDAQCAAERVHAWNERKRSFRTEHIALAWEQLHERQWI